MAKWLKDYLSFGSRKVPPQPPTPDYTESEILKAYRLQRDLDFEDPYEDPENRLRSESSDPATPVYGSPMKSSSVDMKSPKHRLIKVDSQELGRTKILLSAISLEEHAEPVRASRRSARCCDVTEQMGNLMYERSIKCIRCASLPLTRAIFITTTALLIRLHQPAVAYACHRRYAFFS